MIVPIISSCGFPIPINSIVRKKNSFVFIHYTSFIFLHCMPTPERITGIVMSHFSSYIIVTSHISDCLFTIGKYITSRLTFLYNIIDGSYIIGILTCGDVIIFHILYITRAEALHISVIGFLPIDIQTDFTAESGYCSCTFVHLNVWNHQVI